MATAFACTLRQQDIKPDAFQAHTSSPGSPRPLQPARFVGTSGKPPLNRRTAVEA
ncbi:hypothetical protein FA13DRAFT_1724454, partial [Coprinellus micaceus]